MIVLLRLWQPRSVPSLESIGPGTAVPDPCQLRTGKPVCLLAQHDNPMGYFYGIVTNILCATVLAGVVFGTGGSGGTIFENVPSDQVSI